MAETKRNTSISDTRQREIERGEQAPVVQQARERKESNIKKYENAIQQYGEPKLLRDFPSAKTIKKPSASTLAMNTQLEEFRSLAKKQAEAKTNAANTIKAAARRKVEQNELSSLKQELGDAATKVQNAMRNRTAKREMMKQRQTVKEAELKQMQADKERQINQLATTTLQSASKRATAQGKM